MIWPFSRPEPAAEDRESSVPRDRAGEAKRAEAELRARTRRRLLGAAVLLVAAVIFVPMLLETGRRPLPEDITITVETARPSGPPAEVPPAAVARSGEGAAAAPGPERVDSPPKSEPTAPAQEAAPPPAPTASASAPAQRESVEAAAAKEAAPTSTAKGPATGRYAVQVAALSTATDAEELMVRLIKDGFTAYVEAARTASGTLHRVRVGPFKTREQAQRAAERLKADGHKATLVGG